MSFIEDTIANSLNDVYKECNIKLCAVNDLLDELSLMCCDHNNTGGIDYTCKHEGMGYRTFIDHVFVSASINQCVYDLQFFLV